MNSNEFNVAQERAERQRQFAIRDAEHALVWLNGSREKGTGSVPWAYDLNEALGLLQEAMTAIGRSLNAAVDPDRTVVEDETS